MQKSLKKLWFLPIVLLLATACTYSLGKQSGNSTNSAYNQNNGYGNSSNNTQNQNANQQTINDSRQAIIATGFSPQYFDQHFSYAGTNTVNNGQDTLVKWNASINGYQTSVIDDISNGTHNVSKLLGKSRDITNTIPQSTADQKLSTCLNQPISNITKTVVLAKDPNTGQTELMLLGGYQTNTSQQQNSGQQSNPMQNMPNMMNPNTNQPQSGSATYAYVNLEDGSCHQISQSQ